MKLYSADHAEGTRNSTKGRKNLQMEVYISLETIKFLTNLDTVQREILTEVNFDGC